MREILHIQVGQGGNNIGAKVRCCTGCTNKKTFFYVKLHYLGECNTFFTKIYYS